MGEQRNERAGAEAEASGAAEGAGVCTVMEILEIYAKEASNGQRLLCEREGTEDGSEWWCFAEIRMPVADLLTNGWRMGVELARDYVRSGVCGAARVKYIQSRKGVRDIVRVYERAEECLTARKNL